MDFWSEIEEAVGEVIDWFKKPPEPLVLGAELWCPYGSEHTYLMLERDDIDIDNLPQANVDDCKKSVNIFPFGECAGGSLCEYRMELEKHWENPEPQTEIVNGKEVITTKSVLLCRAGGMEIQAANSGQEFGKKLAEQINLKIKMDAEYPGLYDLLTDPYGSLYLNEGMYETALAFLADRMTDKGDIFLPAVFDGNDLENEMVRLALGKLMPRCDVSTYDRFINGLEDTGLLTGMNEKEGWDVHYLNNEMMEMLRKDCKTTDERVKTDPEIRWQEENRIFTSSMSDAMTQLSKAVVMYLAMKPQSVEETGEKPVEKVKEEFQESDTETSFTYKLRGENVTLKNVKVKNIVYEKRSSVELKNFRQEFNKTVRKDFLKDLGNNKEYLKEAGFSETDIAKIQNGRVPNGWQVHHKLSLDDSGTNTFDNLVLIQNEPYHKVITNYQNSIARQMKVGEVQKVQWPVPNGNIYPPIH